MASNENGYLGGMMVSYPFRDIEPSTVNDCFGSDSDIMPPEPNVFCGWLPRSRRRERLPTSRRRLIASGSSVLAVVGHRQIGRMSLLFCRGLIGGCDLRRLFLGVPEFCRCVCTYGFDV